MRQLKELGKKLRAERLRLEHLNNELKYIIDTMLELIVEGAAHDLFDTPVVSSEPTDSFEEDYEPEFFMNEAEIKRQELERLNKEIAERLAKEKANRRRHHTPRRCNKRKERLKLKNEKKLLSSRQSLTLSSRRMGQRPKSSSTRNSKNKKSSR